MWNARIRKSTEVTSFAWCVFSPSFLNILSNNKMQRPLLLPGYFWLRACYQSSLLVLACKICGSFSTQLKLRSYSMIQIRINDSQTLGSWHIEGTDESLPRVSLLIPFMYHDPEFPLAACQSDCFWSFISRGATIIALIAIFGYFSQTDSTADFLFVRKTYHSL